MAIDSPTQSSKNIGSASTSDSMVITLSHAGFEALMDAGVFDTLIRNKTLTEDNFHPDIFEDKGKANNVRLHLSTVLACEKMHT
jgi:hypothetical protein